MTIAATRSSAIAIATTVTINYYSSNKKNMTTAAIPAAPAAATASADILKYSTATTATNQILRSSKQ